jgi:hypothetical protein
MGTQTRKGADLVSSKCGEEAGKTYVTMRLDGKNRIAEQSHRRHSARVRKLEAAVLNLKATLQVIDLPPAAGAIA